MKTKTFLKLSVILSFTAFLCISCGKDEVNKNSGSLTCKIDGVDFTAKTFNNTLIGDASGKRLDIRGIDASGKQLIITIGDLDPLGTNFSHIGDTVYVDTFENDQLGLMTLGTLMNPDGSFNMTLGDGKEMGYSILTSCDLSKKNASGLFEFKVVDGNLNTISVTEGKFTDVSFRQ